jgi:hypothetical protein
VNDLKDIKALMWNAATEWMDRLRSIIQTVADVNGLRMKINCWVVEFLRYLESKQTNINFPSIDEQLVERSGELKVLQNRIDYLSIHGKMTVAVIRIVAECKDNLIKAKQAREANETHQVCHCIECVSIKTFELMSPIFNQCLHYLPFTVCL